MFVILRIVKVLHSFLYLSGWIVKRARVKFHINCVQSEIELYKWIQVALIVILTCPFSV